MFVIKHVTFMFVVTLYNMLSYVLFMLCYVITCCVMFMLRYITCNVVMIYNMLSYAMLYNVMLCYVYLTL